MNGESFTRRLVDADGSVFEIEVVGSRVISRSAKRGAPLKAREKNVAQPWQALQEAEAKLFEHLRRGYALDEDTASAGNPVMQRFIGGDYLGFLPLARGVDGRFWVVTQKDLSVQILELDTKPVRSLAFTLIEQCVFAIRYAAETDALLMNIDHRIELLRLASGEREVLQASGREPLSALDYAAGRALWLAGDRIVIVDLASRTELLTRRVVPPEAGSGKRVTGRLSPDGRRVLIGLAPGRYAVLDVDSGAVEVEFESFEALLGCAFHPSASYVLAIEHSASVRVALHAAAAGARSNRWPPPKLATDASVGFFVVNGELRVPLPANYYDGWEPEEGEERFTDMGLEAEACAFSPSGAHVAFGGRRELRVADFDTGALVRTLRVEQCGRRFSFEFLSEDRVVVRTDAGVVTIYAI